MKLENLVEKINKANKINEELEIANKINLVLFNKYDSPIRLYTKKDIKKISDKYVDTIANKILNNELIKIERYMWEILETEFKIQIEFGLEV